MTDVVYKCKQYPHDTLGVDFEIHDDAVFVECEDGDTAETVCVVLDKEDALDLARRINEAFGDGNA